MSLLAAMLLDMSYFLFKPLRSHHFLKSLLPIQTTFSEVFYETNVKWSGFAKALYFIRFDYCLKGLGKKKHWNSEYWSFTTYCDSIISSVIGRLYIQMFPIPHRSAATLLFLLLIIYFPFSFFTFYFHSTSLCYFIYIFVHFFLFKTHCHRK